MKHLYHIIRYGEWCIDFNSDYGGKWLNWDRFYYDGWHIWLKVGRVVICISY
jgi:hypothetical protein